MGCLVRSWQARGCAAAPASREMRPRRLCPGTFFSSVLQAASTLASSSHVRVRAGVAARAWSSYAIAATRPDDVRPRTGRAGAAGRGDES